MPLLKYTLEEEVHSQNCTCSSCTEKN